MPNNEPEMYAAQAGRVGAVQALLNAGASLNVKDNSGKTPLSWAEHPTSRVSEANKEATVAALTSAGATE